MVSPFLRKLLSAASHTLSSFRAPIISFRSPYLTQTQGVPQPPQQQAFHAAATNAAVASSPSPSSIPNLSFARYDSTLGLSVSTTDPSHDSTSQIIADTLSWNLTFTYGAQIEHFLGMVAIFLGVSLLFFGVRLFKPLLLGVSWFSIGAMSYLVLMLLTNNSTISFITAVIFGFLCAIIVIKVWKLSLFLLGGLFGLVMWIMFHSLFPSAIASLNIQYAVMSVVVVGCGVGALFLEKYALLISTPVLGAFLFLQGLNHFIDFKVNTFSLLTKDGQTMCEGRLVCYFLYLALIGLSVAGAVVQWKYTSDVSMDDYLKDKKKDRLMQKKQPEMIILSSPKKHSPTQTSRLPVHDRSGGNSSSGSGNPFARNRSAMFSGGYGQASHHSEPEYFEG